MRGALLAAVLIVLTAACGSEGVGVRDARPVTFGEPIEEFLLPAEPIALHMTDTNPSKLIIIFAEAPWVRMVTCDGLGGFYPDRAVDFDLSRAIPEDLTLTLIDAVMLDFSGDGLMDLAVLDEPTGRTHLFQRVGNTFEYRQWIMAPWGDGEPSEVIGLAADQMNRGGSIDFAVATPSATYLHFHQETRLRWLLDERGIDVGSEVDQIVTGDFTLDGNTDIASAGAEGILLTRRNTRGVFIRDERFHIDAIEVSDLATGDLNGDQMLDLIVARRTHNGIQLWLTDIDREWTANDPRRLVVPAPVKVIAHDVTGDGLLDLVVASGAEAAGAAQILVVPQVP